MFASCRPVVGLAPPKRTKLLKQLSHGGSAQSWLCSVCCGIECRGPPLRDEVPVASIELLHLIQCAEGRGEPVGPTLLSLAESLNVLSERLTLLDGCP